MTRRRVPVKFEAVRRQRASSTASTRRDEFRRGRTCRTTGSPALPPGHTKPIRPYNISGGHLGRIQQTGNIFPKMGPGPQSARIRFGQMGWFHMVSAVAHVLEDMTVTCCRDSMEANGCVSSGFGVIMPTHCRRKPA